VLGIRPPPSRERSEEVEVLGSNLQAFMLWRACRKPLTYDWGIPCPQELDTAEIAAVANVHDVELRPQLHQAVIQLDAHYVQAARKAISDQTKSNK